MGRHTAEINQKSFESLCGLQCTIEEICAFFGVTDKTLQNWCKRTYKKEFSLIYKEKRGLGNISLRRTQFRLADKNATMAIFLGKQYLGQRDYVQADLAVEMEDDPITKALKAANIDGGIEQ